MWTYSLQCVATLLLLAIAILAQAVARESRGADPHHRAAWRLTGLTWVVCSAHRIAANAYQGAALGGGSGSPAWSSYLRWRPVFNHSRTFLMLGAAAAFVVLALWRGPPGRRFWRIAIAALAVGLAVGIA